MSFRTPTGDDLQSVRDSASGAHRQMVVMSGAAPSGNVNVAIGSSHAESAAITATQVRLLATSNCYIAFGAAPVADTSSMILQAGFPEYFSFTTGQKISVLQVTAAGVLSITPA